MSISIVCCCSPKTKKITITVSQAVYERLEELSSAGGRSVSNLAAFLLERAIQKQP